MERSNEILYPMLVVSGISVTVFSLLGIITLAGWVPYASSHEHPSVIQSLIAEVTPFELNPSIEEPAQNINPPCRACGVVESIRISAVATSTSRSTVFTSSVEAHGVPAQVGAAASRAYVGQDTRRHLRYVVHVSMNDGSYRSFYLDDQPVYRVGEQIRLDHGSPVAMN